MATLQKTGSCSVVTSSRFAYHLAEKHGGNVWRSTRRDPDEPSVTVWFCITRVNEEPNSDVSPGGWKLIDTILKEAVNE